MRFRAEPSFLSAYDDLPATDLAMAPQRPRWTWLRSARRPSRSDFAGRSVRNRDHGRPGPHRRPRCRGRSRRRRKPGSIRAGPMTTSARASRRACRPLGARRDRFGASVPEVNQIDTPPRESIRNSIRPCATTRGRSCNSPSTSCLPPVRSNRNTLMLHRLDRCIHGFRWPGE